MEGEPREEKEIRNEKDNRMKRIILIFLRLPTTLLYAIKWTWMLYIEPHEPLLYSKVSKGKLSTVSSTS